MQIYQSCPCALILSFHFVTYSTLNIMATITVTNTADNGAGSLRDAIANAQTGDTIAFNLAAGSTITLTSGQLNIPVGKNLIIDGAGAPNLSISGNNTSRIFGVNANVVTSTSLTIRNLTLRNAFTTQRGGAILTTDEVDLTLDNVTFRNNVANQGGGAVYANWNSNIFVSNSRFENNVAIAGNDERGAGAIAFVSPGILQVTNSDFIGNRGINGAAINSLNGKLTIENSRFTNNDTTAAFYDTNNANPFLRGYGGAVYTDRASSTSESAGTIHITGSVFEGNRGRGEGGAAYLFAAANQDNVILENTRFVNNSVVALPNGGNNGNGGAVTVISNGFNKGLTVQNTTFANNSATSQGGGLWIYDSPATIINSTFSGNQAGGGPGSIYAQVGGGITIYNAPASITNTTFANNNADWVGGALTANSSAVVKLTNSLFSNNTADNQFQIQQHAAGQFVDGGGNLQFPAKLTNFGNDYNVLPNITIANPLLNPLQFVNGALVHTLGAGSPAIDQGVTTGLGTDQTGAPRPQDGDLNGTNVFDIGAVETPGTPVAEIGVLNGATNIADGTTTPINFGTVLVGDVLERAFTITNTGNAALSLSNLNLPTGFSLVGALPSTVTPGSSIPLVIRVDTAIAGTFTGTLSLTNNDSNESPFDFVIQATVKGQNNAPIVTTPLLDQTATATQPFQYTIASNTFTDPDNDALTLQATLTGGNPLPSWLNFNATTRTFSGTPPTGVNSLSLDLTANDGFGGTITDTFVLTVNPAPILPINGTNRSDTIVGTTKTDRIFGFGGHDILSGNLGDDEIWGGVGNDRLHGQDGNDQLYGEAGNDQLYGGNGNDTLWGGVGNDLLLGGAGSDRLIGGAGNDVLTGAVGADVFVLEASMGTDIIRDFRLGQDQIGLAGGLSLGQLSITQNGSQTWIRNTATTELLARLEGVNAANLITQSNTAFVVV